jgi:hypothetical protein
MQFSTGAVQTASSSSSSSSCSIAEDVQSALVERLAVWLSSSVAIMELVWKC